jgi:hypothetical protein
VLVEDRHQVVGDNVLVRVLRNEIVGHCDKWRRQSGASVIPPLPVFCVASYGYLP